MFGELPEEFDYQKFQKQYVAMIAAAFAVPRHYLMSRKELQAEMDLILEQIWDAFGDVPINAQEEIEHAFMHWPAGTDRFEIWHWFDEKHSKGVAYLTNADGSRDE